MKRLIKNITVISLVVGFSGCVQNKTVLNTPNLKTNIYTKKSTIYHSKMIQNQAELKLSFI